MTDDKVALLELIEKSADADLVLIPCKPSPRDAKAIGSSLTTVADLSSSSLAVQRMAVALGVELGDRVVDGAVEVLGTGEGLVR